MYVCKLWRLWRQADAGLFPCGCLRCGYVEQLESLIMATIAEALVLMRCVTDFPELRTKYSSESMLYAGGADTFSALRYQSSWFNGLSCYIKIPTKDMTKWHYFSCGENHWLPLLFTSSYPRYRPVSLYVSSHQISACLKIVILWYRSVHINTFRKVRSAWVPPWCDSTHLWIESKQAKLSFPWWLCTMVLVLNRISGHETGQRAEHSTNLKAHTTRWAVLFHCHVFEQFRLVNDGAIRSSECRTFVDSIPKDSFVCPIAQIEVRPKSVSVFLKCCLTLPVQNFEYYGQPDHDKSKASRRGEDDYRLDRWA